MIDSPNKSSGTESAIATSTSPPRVVRFGVFEVDLTAGEVRKAGLRQKLVGQPFQLLQVLLERPGEVVTRDELRQRIWAENTIVDYDLALKKAVSRVREVLGDSAERPQFIETVPRRGYRFIGSINVPPLSTESREQRRPGTESSESAASRTGKRAWSFLKLGFALASLAAAGFLLWTHADRLRTRIFATSRLAEIHSVAVLPFKNLSEEPDQDFFADGMTESLITDLGKISAIRVISRTSVMQYKGTKKPIPEIARELNVDALIEGTVSRSRNHLRITANLLQASPEKHLWAESYDAEIRDTLTTQSQLAQAVAREIQVSLNQTERQLLDASRPVNPEAQDLYFKGLYTRNAGTSESAKKATDYFQQAIQKDPGYAPPYSALASTYSNWIPGMSQNPRDLMPVAKEYALKALQLDATLCEPHSVLGRIKLYFDWDWAAAEEEYRQTMNINPSLFWAHIWHSRGLVTRGRTEDAVAEAKLALTIDPNPEKWDYPVWIFVLARRYDLASKLAEEQVKLAPNFVWGHFELAQVYEQQGRVEEAARESLKADELFGIDSKKLELSKEAMAKAGAQGYWRRTVENFRGAAKSGYVPPVLVAQACVRIGDKECAFQWLEKGFEERDDLMINLKVEPVFDDLRADPRFQDLIRRVGIPQ